jgi:ankyrin repeat protein
VEFQLQELCDADSDHSIMAVLRNLPKSLIETYDRLLNKIEAADRRTIIKKMFEWIICARQPLLVDELREGISFTLEDDLWDQAKIMTNFARLLRACGNLVVVDTFEEQIDKPFKSVKKTRFVQLAHYTLQQYLLLRKEGRFHFNMNEANAMVGEVCVAYLSFNNFNSQLVRFKENTNTDMVNWSRLAGQGAILPSDLPGRRAVQMWKALRSADTTSMEINMVRHIPRLKREPELAAFNLVSYISTHWLWHTIHFKSENSADIISHRRIARRDDLFRDLILHKHLLFKFRPWEAVNSSNGHLTYIAILGWGFAANHQYLIEIASQRFDQNEPVTVVQQAWEWLLAHGCNGFLNGHISKAMVDQLEAFSEDSYSMEQPELAWLYSRLLCACRKGHLDVIRDLDLGISQVDPSIIKYMLIEAAASGQLPVVSYLQSILDPSESVLSAAWKGQYLNALERAVLGGHPQVVMFLKEQGYKISNLFIHVYSYFELVDSAVDQDKPEVLRCLFLVTDKTRSGPGIDEHIPDNQAADKFTLTDRRGTVAFFRAIENGSLRVVQAMLEYGVYPDMHDERGYTALIAAITTSQEAIVQILLSYNCHTGNTAAGMPLTVAASMGNLAIAKLLLHSGAEVFADKLSNPRSSAMVSLIGNEPHELDGNPGFGDLCICPTPLFMACYHGHREMVQMLLKNGAAPDFPSVMALTHIYRSSGESANPVRHVDLFLHNIGTAKVANHVIWYWEKEQNSTWQYPLTAALLQGHEDIVQLLVEAGVQPPLSSTCRSGPLSGQSLLREFKTLHASELLKQMGPGLTHSLEKEIFTNIATGLSYFTTISVNYFEDLFAYVETLIAAGVPVNEAELDGKPILIFALENNQHMLVKRVLQQMPADALHSSLVSSVKNNMPSLIPALLRAGATISRQDDNGVDIPNQSLIHAAVMGDSFLYDALIEATMVATLCSVTSNPRVSFEESSRSRENLQRIIICILLEMSEETPQASWYCDILQHLARRDGNFGSLLSALFNLTATFPNGRPLMNGFLFAAIEKEDCDLVMLLCDKGADVNAEFPDDTNHLIRAVKRARSPEMIRTLLALGADPDITDASGVSAIQIATEYYGELDPVWCLLTNNQSAQTDGRQQVLDLCVAEGLEATWRVITGLDLHETLYLDDTCFPSYLMARGQYLLNAPCNIIPGIFELAHEVFELTIDAPSPAERKKPT